MQMTWKKVIGVAVVLSMSATAFGLDLQPKSATFKTLYGREVGIAARSRITSDDVRVAGKLLDVAKSQTVPDDDYIYDLCMHAYELGRADDTGYATAIDALVLLASKQRDMTLTCAEKLFPLFQAQYAKSNGPKKKELARQLFEAAVAIGDYKLNVEAAPGSDLPTITYAVLSAQKHFAIAERIAKDEGIDVPLIVAQGIATAHARLDALRRTQQDRKLLKNPGISPDQKQRLAQRVLPIFIVDLDDPALAIAEQVIIGAPSGQYKRNVLIASGAVTPTDPAQWRQMGNWYRDHWASSENDAIKSSMAARAEFYYEKYLASAGVGSAGRRDVDLALSILRGGSPVASVAEATPKQPTVAEPAPKPKPVPSTTPKPTPTPQPKPVIVKRPDATVAPDAEPREASTGFNRRKFLLPVPESDGGRRGFFGLPTD